MELEFDAAADAEAVLEVDIAEDSKVGRSSMSAKRSTFRDRRRAFLRLSSNAFSARMLYVSLKCIAASSSLGRASRREAVDCASAGRVVLKVDRCVDELIMALWERLERDWRERSRE